MKQGIVFILLGFCMNVQALTLKPIEPIKQVTLQVNEAEPNIPCDQINARLNKYADMTLRHNNSANAFFQQLTQALSDWHTLLAPYENGKKTLEEGTFDVLSQGSEQVYLATDYAINNTSLLANELDRIIVSLRDCSISNIEVTPNGRGNNNRNLPLH
jgi:hypothetical protein